MTSQAHEPYVPVWTIGDRLRRIRRDSGLTQPQFAARLGVGDKRYAAWESDTNAPPSRELLTVAHKIEVLYGRDAMLWLLGVDTPTPDPDPGERGTGASGATDELARLTEQKRLRRRAPSTSGYVALERVAA